MSRKLYRRERLDIVLRELQESGYVSVAEMSELLDVSAVTLRSDLDELEQAGKLLRTHGGAVPVRLDEGLLSFSVRQREHVGAKQRIGSAAAGLVSDGEAIVLDASTTSWHVARALLSHRDLTVLTTGLYIAMELLRSPGISVLIPGGRVWREAAALVGDLNEEILKGGNLQRAFFGGRGITVEEGLTDPNLEEVAMKRDLLGQVNELNVIIDASKIGKVAFASCAGIEDIDRVITEKSAPHAFVEGLRDRGVEVMLI